MLIRFAEASIAEKHVCTILQTLALKAMVSASRLFNVLISTMPLLRVQAKACLLLSAIPGVPAMRPASLMALARLPICDETIRVDKHALQRKTPTHAGWRFLFQGAVPGWTAEATPSRIY